MPEPIEPIVDMRPVVPVASADTETLTALAAELEPGVILTDKEASRAVGHQVGPKDMQGVKRRVLHLYGVILERVRNVGYKRVDGHEAVYAQKAGVARIRREARRRAKKLSVVDVSKLENAQKTEAFALASLFGVVGHISNARGLKRIEGAVGDVSKKLSIGGTLALFVEEKKKPDVTGLDMTGRDETGRDPT